MIVVLLILVGIFLLVAGITSTVTNREGNRGTILLGRVALVLGGVLLVLAIAYIVAVAAAAGPS